MSKGIKSSGRKKAPVKKTNKKAPSKSKKPASAAMVSTGITIKTNQKKKPAPAYPVVIDVSKR